MQPDEDAPVVARVTATRTAAGEPAPAAAPVTAALPFGTAEVTWPAASAEERSQQPVGAAGARPAAER